MASDIVIASPKGAAIQRIASAWIAALRSPDDFVFRQTIVDDDSDQLMTN